MLLTLTGAASGRDNNNPFSSDVDEHYVPGEAWKEGAVKVPDYPNKDDLLFFPVDSTDGRFKFAVDGKNLSVGRDQVIRFSVVITSGSGVQNAMFEGIRCDTHEYKTYAYGTSEGKFVEARSSKWKIIDFVVSGSMAYRRQLHNYFFCSNNLPEKKEIILRRLKYEANRVDSDTTFW